MVGIASYPPLFKLCDWVSHTHAHRHIIIVRAVTHALKLPLSLSLLQRPNHLSLSTLTYIAIARYIYAATYVYHAYMHATTTFKYN